MLILKASHEKVSTHLLFQVDFRVCRITQSMLRHINVTLVTEKYHLFTRPQCQRRDGHLQGTIQGIKAWMYILQALQSCRPLCRKIPMEKGSVPLPCSARGAAISLGRQKTGRNRHWVLGCSPSPLVVGSGSSRELEREGRIESRKVTGR